MKIEFKKVLAVGAHFDDVEICCGGTLAKFHEAGSEIKIIVVGDGNYQHYDGTVLRKNQDAVQEGVNALQQLGINDKALINLRYPEKKIIFNEKLIGDLEKIIDDFNPDLIITHWLHDSHQDHVAVSNATISAARYYYSIWMWEPIFPSGRAITIPYVPQIYVDITRFGAIKNESLKCHKTQVNKFNNRGIKWVEGIDVRAKFRGFESGSELAETFYVYRQKIK
jgi:LmbE family N-acetylglucosaminyl deacetylase